MAAVASEETADYIFRLIFRPEDEGSIFLQKFCVYLRSHHCYNPEYHTKT